MMPIRFYDDDRLRSYEDWVLITEDDMLEFLERSERLSKIEAAIKDLRDGVAITEVFPSESLYDGEVYALLMGLADLLAA